MIASGHAAMWVRRRTGVVRMIVGDASAAGMTQNSSARSPVLGRASRFIGAPFECGDHRGTGAGQLDDEGTKRRGNEFLQNTKYMVRSPLDYPLSLRGTVG